MIDMLVLCTANSCRSVLAEELLAAQLTELGVTARVSSAGLGPPGWPALPEVVELLSARGIDVTWHRSIQANADVLNAADLVLAMTREHLRFAAVTAPATWPRTFTLRELVRLGSRIGPRAARQSLAAWLGLAHANRERRDLLGDRETDDIADPIGGPPDAFAALATELQILIAHLTSLVWPPWVVERELPGVAASNPRPSRGITTAPVLRP